MAIFKVNSVEKAISTRCSLKPSFESLRCPLAMSMEQPIEVEAVCMTVRSHGNLACCITALFDNVRPRLRKKYKARNTSFLLVETVYSTGAPGVDGTEGRCASRAPSSFNRPSVDVGERNSISKLGFSSLRYESSETEEYSLDSRFVMLARNYVEDAVPAE